jgi:Short C-terminal domain
MAQPKKITGTSFFTLIVSIFGISFLLLYSNGVSYHSQAAAAQTLLGPEPNYLLYSNPTYGIKIQYPEDWQITEGKILGRLKANNTVAVAEFHPLDMSVGVILSVEKLLKNETLDQYVEESIALSREQQPDAQLIERNKTMTLTGLPGYKLVWNGILDAAEASESGRFDFGGLENVIDFQPINTTVMSFFTIHGDNAYVIGYSDVSSGMLDQVCNSFGADLVPFCSSPANIINPFSHYLPIAQKMIDSFEIATQNQTIGNNGGTNMTGGDDPLNILDQRLARGEITIEEYERLREILER